MRSRLRLLLIAPLVAPINDVAGQIGGAQVLLASLARGLARRGHAVTVLAAPGSSVEAVEVVHIPIEKGALRPASFEPGARRSDDEAQARAFVAVREWIDAHSRDIDVAHAHAFDAPAFRALVGAPVPVMHTLHLPPLDPDVVGAAAEATDALMVTVSNANARAWRAAGVRVDRVVMNGIAVDEIPFGQGASGRLLCAGRISPEKGPDVAIRAARAAGRAIDLVGGVYDTGFFERDVRPLLGDDARHLGRIPRADLYRLMADARALLMPVRWDEPFGLVAVEAQAAGTPVAGFARGALPEVVVDGASGVLVAPDDEAALAEAIPRTARIQRSECRANAARFSEDSMLRGYEELYVSLSRSSG